MTNTTNQPQEHGKKKLGIFQRFLDTVEYIGNKFPSPFILFSIMALIVLLLSKVFEGVSVEYIGAGGENVTKAVVSLLNADGFRYILTDMVSIFIKFPPLGLVIMMMMALGLAEKTGLVTAFVRKVMLGVPEWAITATIFILGICGNLASDAATVFVPAAAAAVYASMGRNPILGLSIAFAATQAGFSANFLPAGTDVIISSITKSAVGIIPQTANSPAHPLINYYFMASSVVVLAVVGVFIAEKIVGPRVNRLHPINEFAIEVEDQKISQEEERGLRFAKWTAIGYVLIILALLVPEFGLLRNPETHAIIPRSPFLSGIVPILFFFFLFVGVAFGLGKRVIKKESDVAKFMAQGLAGVLSFVVTAFSAAQFIAWFTKTNLATVLAVKGANLLKSLDLTGLMLIVCLILLSAFLDMFVTSGGVKWLILAPIFVPMFGLLGMEPALTQAAYRVGESSINSMTPLNYYIPVMLGIIAKYSKSENKIGIGTLVALQLPYGIGFLLAWSSWLIIYLLLGLPLGPGVNAFM